MNKKKFTPISDVGEFNLIENLVSGFKIHHKSTKSKIGDDAAVFSFIKGTDHITSSDMLVEGVHFDPTYCPIKHVGYKSIVANISDICAMNGTPTHVLVSLGIPNKYSVELISELYDGIRLACKNYNIDLIGGDTTATPHNLVIGVTIFGSGETKKTTYRSGAKPNDLLVVSGNLGSAYLGLQILEREKMIFEQNTKSQPSLKKYPYILERQLKPEARIDIMKLFIELNIQPTSMIDISDGLSSEALHIAKASGVGVKIFENKIPISEEAKQTAKELNIDATICALHGGEDYELLFTASLNCHKTLINAPDCTIIGHITDEKNKVKLITPSGQELDLVKYGWEAFRKNTDRKPKHI